MVVYCNISVSLYEAEPTADRLWKKLIDYSWANSNYSQGDSYSKQTVESFNVPQKPKLNKEIFNTLSGVGVYSQKWKNCQTFCFLNFELLLLK